MRLTVITLVTVNETHVTHASMTLQAFRASKVTQPETIIFYQLDTLYNIHDTLLQIRCLVVLSNICLITQ